MAVKNYGVQLGTSIADKIIGKFCVIRRDTHSAMFGTVQSFKAYAGKDGERKCRGVLTNVRTMYGVRPAGSKGTNLSDVAVVGINHGDAEVGSLKERVEVTDICELILATDVARLSMESCPVTQED